MLVVFEFKQALLWVGDRLLPWPSSEHVKVNVAK